MEAERLTTIGLQTIGYALGGTFFSLIGTFALLSALFLISPFKALHEIEEENNPAVGAAFMVLSVLASFACVLMIWTPAEGTIRSGIGWLFFGLLIGTALYIPLATLALWNFCRNNAPDQRNPIAFLRHEVLVDKNAGLVLFLGAIALNVYVPAIASALSA